METNDPRYPIDATCRKCGEPISLKWFANGLCAECENKRRERASIEMIVLIVIALLSGIATVVFSAIWVPSEETFSLFRTLVLFFLLNVFFACMFRIDHQPWKRVLRGIVGLIVLEALFVAVFTIF